MLLGSEGAFIDQPKPHPIAFFKNNHCVERGVKDRQPGCSAVKTDVTVLGFVDRVAIVRIVYEVGSSGPYFDGKYYQPQYATTILAKTGPNEYGEIFHQLNCLYYSYFTYVKLFTVDGTSFIYSQLDNGGNVHGFTESIFRVGAYGVRLLDPKPIHDEASRVIPTDFFGYPPSSAFSFKERTWRIATEPKNLKDSPRMSCCRGTGEVKFKIEDGKFIPTSSKYFPRKYEPERYWREVN